MNNFREWLSDNLRYILLGIGVLVILIGLFFGIRAVSKSLNNKADTEQSDDKQGDSSGSQTSKEETTPTPEVEENPLEKNAYPEVNALLNTYYTALGNKDVAAVKEVLDVLNPTEEAKITNAKYIEGYKNLEVYTKEGMDKGSYVVYAYYNYVCTGINTPVPALSWLYVVTREDGKLEISTKAQDDPEIQAYIEKVQQDQDVKDLIAEVYSANEKAKENDPALKEFLDGLGTDTGTGAVSGDTATANEDCNMREEASSDSEIIDGIPAGTQVKKLGTEGDWVKVEYNGETGYVYGELLQ